VSLGWTDSQLVAGYVFASDEVANRARERATGVFGALRSQHRCQLTAHATLQFLDRLTTDGIWTTAAATAARFSQALTGLAASCPLIRDVWGEGLLWVMQFDLDGWPRFVRDWFVTFLWAECMRDRENPIVVSWQVHEPACIRLEPRYDLPIDELEAALDTLRRALSKGVNGIVHDVANEAARRGDVRRADMFHRMLRDREQHDGSTVGSAG
jgi:4-aminobutyrate aminotransferase-like enzyme